MDKGKMHYLIGIVYQYGGLLVVADWELKVRGGILTHIFYNEDADILQFFNGDMVNDKYAEEVFPTDEEFEEIFKEVTDNF
jgi:hypothetical protein